MTRCRVGGPTVWTARVLPTLTIVLGLGAASAFAQEKPLAINDKQYFEKRGLNVLVFSNEYNGMFFDEKTAGIELIHHGVRTATGGAVRLKPTPEQWDQIPKVVKRKVDPKTNTIEVTLRYEAFDFDSRVVVTPDGAGLWIAVSLDKPLPAALEGRAGLNLEFLPSAYFERTYLVDGQPRIFPLYPSGPTTSRPPEKRTASSRGTRPSTTAGTATTSRRSRSPRESSWSWPRRIPSAASRSGRARRPAAARRAQRRAERLVRRAHAARAGTTGKVVEWSVRRTRSRAGSARP